MPGYLFSPASLRSPVFPPLLPVLSRCLLFRAYHFLCWNLSKRLTILLILFLMFLSSPSVLESSSNLQTASSILLFHGSMLEEARFSKENRQSRRETKQDRRDVQAYIPHLLRYWTQGFCGGLGWRKYLVLSVARHVVSLPFPLTKISSFPGQA